MRRILYLIVILALAGGVYYAFFWNKGQPNVALSFERPDNVLVGQPFTLKISYSNGSNEILKNAKLSITVPDSVSFLGDTSYHLVNEIALGDVPAHTTGEKELQLIVLSDPQTVKRIETKITYGLESSTSNFENDGKTDIGVGDPAISLTVETPDRVVSGEDFQLIIHYKNNTADEYQNSKIVLNYPPAFTFGSSDPAPSSGKNQWNIGSLASSSEGKITINGRGLGNQGTALNFGVEYSAQFLGKSYLLERQVVALSLAEPPLSISIAPNSDRNYVTGVGDRLHYALTYKNNSSVALQNISIKAILSGSLLDMSSLQTDGTLNSINNTISWNVASTPSLSNISPGGEGVVEFTVGLISAFPIRRMSDKNFTVKVHATAESPTVPPGITSAKTISSDDLETKVRGKVELDSYALRYDSAISNSGPYPPKVNQATQYTVHWKITNYGTDVSSVKISAFLKSGTVFTGKTGPTSYPPKYDARTGEITWEIPNIPATVGVLGAPQELIFQVSNTPAQNQVGSDILLMSGATISAKDDFTGSGLSDTTDALTSDLRRDTKITINDRTVRP